DIPAPRRRTGPRHGLCHRQRRRDPDRRAAQDRPPCGRDAGAAGRNHGDRAGAGQRQGHHLGTAGLRRARGRHRRHRHRHADRGALMDRMVATVFGIGYLRPAPGTWASAVTVLLAVLAYECLSPWLVPAGFVAATLLGFWTVPRLLATGPDRDPSWVVIDEVAGQSLALCFTVVPLARHGVSILDAWPGYVVPFLLFRLFDIWKPWLV